MKLFRFHSFDLAVKDVHFYSHPQSSYGVRFEFEKFAKILRSSLVSIDDDQIQLIFPRKTIVSLVAILKLMQSYLIGQDEQHLEQT